MGGDFDVYSAGGFLGVEDGACWEEAESGFGLGFWGFGGVGVVELLAEYLVAAADANNGYVSVCRFDDCLIESSGFHPAEVGDGAFGSGDDDYVGGCEFGWVGDYSYSAAGSAERVEVVVV